MSATRSIADLPSPPAIPLLGQAHRVRRGSLHLTIERWCERYGPIFRFRIGPRRFVAVGELAEINRILRDRPQGFRRWRERQEIFHEMGIHAVFPAEGEDWRRQRRLAVTALNPHQLQRNFHVLQTATERLYRRIAQAAREEHSLDIAIELKSFTIDVTGALAFGLDLNTLDGHDQELQEHIQRVFQMLTYRSFAPLPYWRLVRFPTDRALDRSLLALYKRIAVFVERTREHMARHPRSYEAPENLLEEMIAAQRAEGRPSDEEIAGNALCFLIAGEDTTAHTLAWTVWFLASRPATQARLAEEARAVLGEQILPARYETVAQLRYAEAVLCESLRLKPVIPVSTVEPILDTTILDTRIPAGTRLWLLTRQAGLNGGGETVRADEFDPQRWLNHGQAPERGTLLAFGAGPRFCPGRNLALLESRCVLAMLARNFFLELDERAGPVRELFTTTVVPHGLRVRVRARGVSGF